HSQRRAHPRDGYSASFRSIFVLESRQGLGCVGMGRRCAGGGGASNVWPGWRRAVVRYAHRGFRLDVVSTQSRGGRQLSARVTVPGADALDDGDSLAGAATPLQLVVFARNSLVLRTNAQSLELASFCSCAYCRGPLVQS